MIYRIFLFVVPSLLLCCHQHEKMGVPKNKIIIEKNKTKDLVFREAAKAVPTITPSTTNKP